MPWHQEKDPYKIWLSEIILQQTRVAQGISYYNKFVSNFKDVHELAKAKEDKVMKLWEGLGYYSRARNLHKTAKIISEEYQGQFPNRYEGLLKLPGIGPYTAAAIASFAFGERKAVVDGNVLRVLSRVYGIDQPIDDTVGKKQFAKLAQELIQDVNPADYNQAIMNFGALHCKPKLALCSSCTLNQICSAYQENKVGLLPVKSKKTKVSNRYFHFFYVFNNESCLIIKRNETDIWKGLYQFPLLEKDTDLKLSFQEINQFVQNFSEQFIVFKVSKPVKHKLTHRNIHARFYRVFVHKFNDQKNETYKLIPNQTLGNFAFPRLIDLYLDKKPIPLFKS